MSLATTERQQIESILESFTGLLESAQRNDLVEFTSALRAMDSFFSTYRWEEEKTQQNWRRLREECDQALAMVMQVYQERYEVKLDAPVQLTPAAEEWAWVSKELASISDDINQLNIEDSWQGETAEMYRQKLPGQKQRLASTSALAKQSYAALDGVNTLQKGINAALHYTLLTFQTAIESAACRSAKTQWNRNGLLSNVFFLRGHSRRQAVLDYQHFFQRTIFVRDRFLQLAEWMVYLSDLNCPEWSRTADSIEVSLADATDKANHNQIPDVELYEFRPISAEQAGTSGSGVSFYEGYAGRDSLADKIRSSNLYQGIRNSVPEFLKI